MRHNDDTNRTCAAIPLSGHELRRISVAACVDPRTVKTFLQGGRTTLASKLCIERALVELGITIPPGDDCAA